MDKKQVNKVLRNVRAGNKVECKDLRSAASSVGIKWVGVKTDDLISSLKSHISEHGAGPGRPNADPTNIVGYKVKIGLRYPNSNGELVTSMKDGETFPTVEDGQKAVDKLVEAGEVRVWGGTVRAQFLPRYGKS